MVSVNDIQLKIANDLKIIFPNIKRVYRERIRKLKTPSLSIELVFYNASSITPKLNEKLITLDLIYYAESNSIEEGLKVMEKFNNWLSLGLPVKDRFIKVFEEPKFEFVEQDLHYLITFRYFDELNPILVTDDGHIADFDFDDGLDIDNIIKEEDVDRENDDGTIDNSGKDVGDKIIDDNNHVKSEVKKMKYLHMDFEI